MSNPTATPAWILAEKESEEYTELTVGHIDPFTETAGYFSMGTIETTSGKISVGELGQLELDRMASIADALVLQQGHGFLAMEVKMLPKRLRSVDLVLGSAGYSHIETTKGAYTDYLTSLRTKFSDYEAKIEETVKIIDSYRDVLLAHEAKLERAQEELKKERWEKNLAHASLNRSLMRVLREREWLGLRILTELRSSPSIGITELSSRIGKGLDSIAVTLARLAQNKAVNIDGDGFTCTDSAVEMIERFEERANIKFNPEA